MCIRDRDIGYQGLTYVDPESKWYKVFGEFLLKKKKLGLDRWGNDIDPEYNQLYENLANHILENVPEKYHHALYPHHWTVLDWLFRVSKDQLFSQYAQYEYADLFVGLSFEELDELAASFKFENIKLRDELNDILKDYKN